MNLSYNFDYNNKVFGGGKGWDRIEGLITYSANLSKLYFLNKLNNGNDTLTAHVYPKRTAIFGHIFQRHFDNLCR